MSFLYRRDQLILFIGDLAVFCGALLLALFIRHFTFPSINDVLLHVVPFTILFALWLIVFVSVGLYDKHIALFERTLAESVTEAQLINLLIALAFFFVAPVEIQPKTVLALYFVISTALIVVWRLGLFHFVTNQRVCQPVVIVGSGPDIHELVEEVRTTPQSRFECASFVETTGLSPEGVVERVRDEMKKTGTNTIIADPRASVPTDADVLDASFVYEALFERVPLTLAEQSSLSWQRSAMHAVYGVAKRTVDIVLSFLLLLILAILLPFVFIATRLEGKGPLFISQERIGKSWTKIVVYKFRTMTQNEKASGAWVGESTNRVTKVGALLRRTSIDELPQVFSVFTGDLSLIGPRSDIFGLGERLQESLPFYRARYTVTPGISGWAQVNQKYAPGNISPQSIEESRVRLQYDLYYVKHRSLLLDLSITLKTLKTLIKRIIP